MIQHDTILFDVNETMLDLGPMRPKFEAAFGNDAVMATWFSMLLHASTVCALTEVKSTFATLADEMLNKLAARLEIPLSDATRSEILDGLMHLPPYADVKPALGRLRCAGYRTVAFTNSSLVMAKQQMDHAGLSDVLDDVVSVEPTGSFKPDAKVYRFVAEHLKRPIETLRLVAAHDWDTHGALSAGMRAAYLDRSGATYNPRYLMPDICASTMQEFAESIETRDTLND